MSTPALETFLQRWVAFLFSAGWRDPMLDRSHRPTAGMELVTARLARNELTVLQECSGRRAVDVRQGVVWLTGTPAFGDVILRPGDRFDLGSQWPYLIQALEDAEILLWQREHPDHAGSERNVRMC